MKTFEDALISVLRIGEVDQAFDPEESERILRLQGEYMDEIHSSPIIEAAAEAFNVGLARTVEASGRAISVDTAIKNAYKNGLQLGLTIGIQMERQDDLLPQKVPQSQQRQNSTGEIQAGIVGQVVRSIAARVRAAWREIVRPS